MEDRYGVVAKSRCEDGVVRYRLFCEYQDAEGKTWYNLDGPWRTEVEVETLVEEGAYLEELKHSGTDTRTGVSTWCPTSNTDWRSVRDWGGLSEDEKLICGAPPV